tara:strand:- start:294 stop:2471 length:2178 start_codon:yes stop_codon:yes gene_type:complete
MGFFSSLFGTSKSTSPSSTVVQSTSIPKEIAPFLTETLEGYQDLYKNQLERGYQDYTGDTIAPLTQSQEQALTGLEGLRGTTQPFYQTATDRAVGAGASFTPEAAQQYMSPYQQAVTDIEKREAQRNFEGNVLPRLEAQAVGAGAMSGLGSRAGVEMAEAQRNQSQLLSDIQAKGQQRAFDAASKQFEAERTRERGVGQDLGQLAGQSLTSNISEIGAQKAAGEERQNLTQLGLDEAYRKFLEREEFPETTLATYSGGIYGNPLSRTFDQTTNTFGAQPSTGQSLLSLGLGGLGLYGMGKNIFSKEGGYINEQLPVIERANGGDINVRFKKAVQEGLINPRDVDPSNVQQSIQNLLNNLALGNVTKTTEDTVQVDRTGIPYSLSKSKMKKAEEFMPGTSDPMREFNSYSLENPVSPQADLPGDIVDTTKKEMEVIDKDNLNQRIQNLATQKDTNTLSTILGESSADDFGGSNTTTDTKPPKPKTNSNSFLNDLISSNVKYNTMIDKKITSMGELQTQLKDAIEADKIGTKESRNKSNELAFWKSLLVAGEAVGAADPTKGFLNALSKGVSAGGKSVVDARMKLEKEARGDGKKAIDAIKNLMAVETADLKLMQAGVDSKRQLVDSLAKWAKANNIKVDYKKLNAVATYSKNTVDSLGLDQYDKRRGVAENLIKEKLTVFIANGMKGDFPTITEAELEARYKPTTRVGGSTNSNPKGKTAGSVLDN